MNWLAKCFAFHVFGAIPFGHHLYRHSQRFLGSHLITVTDEVLNDYRFHLENFRSGRAVEYGCGSNLLVPLLLRHQGAEMVYAYDVARLATVEQVNHVIRQLAARFTGYWPVVSDLRKDLFCKYRIQYRAPADARNTSLPTGSIDLIYSTSVLEHVPKKEIEQLLAEARRILSPTGRMSHLVCYSDHYAHSDFRLRLFNFYRYSDRQWALFNPPMHYQNRLRHSDYLALFRDFNVGDERESPAVEALPNRISSRFSAYSREDLLTSNGRFLLTNPNTDTCH